MDVKSAFLNGYLNEELYVEQPTGFIDPHHPNYVYILRKALYGLKQAPRAWYERLTEFLVSLQVKQMEDSMFISQSKYAKGLVKKFGLEKLGHKRTPAATHVKLTKDEQGEDVDQCLYRSMIGSLLYLTASRPDITFVVGVCARYQAAPKASHLLQIGQCCVTLIIMSEASGKHDSVKAKVERTPLGVKCMGLKSDSSGSKKKFEKKTTKVPSRKVYQSEARDKTTSNAPIIEDVTDEEELSAENSPIGSNQDAVPDVRASVLADGSTQEISGKESNAHEDSGVPTHSDESSSPSKDDEPVHVTIDDSQSKDSSQAPASIQNISGDDSDDVPLTTSLPDSVAARIKRKRRVPDVEESPASKKKTKSTPTTFKSKQKDVKGKGKQQQVKSKSVKKKTVPLAAEESGSDVEGDVEDILPSEKKKYAGKRIPQNIPVVPIDNVSFHAEGHVQKWKYVCQRKVSKEREVGSDVLECKDVVALIEKAGLMKTILKVGKCYEKLVREFLVNLSVEVGLPESAEFRKVFVRAKCVEFSPAVINKALGRSDVEFVDEELSLDVIAKEITAGQTLKHADTCAVKLPISFPSLLTEIILQQHPQIIRADEVPLPKGVPITLDQRLFMEPHVIDIVVPFSRTSAPAPMSESSTQVIIAELMVVSKALQETIRISTARKLKVDALLLKLQEEEDQEGEPSGAAAAPQDASTEEEGESEENIEDTAGDTSSDA
ncbi:uncharacterized protein LOC130745755 [Lotus japonicus]|uniref:uncharacterized protein LOC130745755 n=1 Tax=Lotus japonicus TaxID=34305 RepID=UPI002585865B|nr:uncharacterized protein LOC130745755 [Lotus japonicus]